ncbi:MAG: hypothetical protein U5L75_01835 [Candidatus Campbellbacteria bacterium]|nr:hypothetical protein [Candidatus Campbellbacteria bacterium]
MQKSTLWTTVIGLAFLVVLVLTNSQTNDQNHSSDQEVVSEETDEQKDTANNTDTTSLCPMEDEPIAFITPSAVEGWDRVVIDEDASSYARYAFSGSVLLPPESTIEPIDHSSWDYEVTFPLSNGDEVSVTISIYELSSESFMSGSYSLVAYDYLADVWYTNAERPVHQNTRSVHNVYNYEKCEAVAVGATTQDPLSFALTGESAPDVSTGHNIYRMSGGEDGYFGDDLFALIHKKTDPSISSSQPPYIINFGYMHTSPTTRGEGAKEEIRETVDYIAQSLVYYPSQP